MSGLGQVRPRGILEVASIYATIQGESTLAGWPCVMVRLSGCPLRCIYCDTPEALGPGEPMAVEEVVEAALRPGIELVEVTGGEPLIQVPEVHEMIRGLLRAGRRVLLETSGAVSIEGVDPGVKIVLDVKTPDSGGFTEEGLRNLRRLREGDEIKFVLVSRADYEWARELVRRERLNEKWVVHFSPAEPAAVQGPDRRLLAEWILEDRLDVRLNLQIHRWIWGDEPGH